MCEDGEVRKGDPVVPDGELGIGFSGDAERVGLINGDWIYGETGERNIGVWW